MEITISKTLKELRRKKGNTQEQLADFLSISTPAVSKWERAEGYPDITLLPAISEFYGVTVDELLGVDSIRKLHKIDSGVKDGLELLKAGKTAEAVRIWRELYAEFPNDHSVIAGLAFALYYDYNGNRQNVANLNEVILLEERILDESTVQHLRDAAIERLCYSYSALGDVEKAKEYANMSGTVNSSREVLTANILSGDEQSRSNRTLIIQLLAILQNAIYHVGAVDWLTRHELVLGLLDLFFDGKNMGAYYGNAANAHYFCARIYAGTEGCEDKVRYHLEKLAECIKNGAEAHPTYGGEIFKGYYVEDGAVIKNSEESLGQVYAKALGHEESPMFDGLRGEKWFEKVMKTAEEG